LIVTSLFIGDCWCFC